MFSAGFIVWEILLKDWRNLTAGMLTWSWWGSYMYDVIFYYNDTFIIYVYVYIQYTQLICVNKCFTSFIRGILISQCQKEKEDRKNWIVLSVPGGWQSLGHLMLVTGLLSLQWWQPQDKQLQTNLELFTHSESAAMPSSCGQLPGGYVYLFSSNSS